MASTSIALTSSSSPEVRHWQLKYQQLIILYKERCKAMYDIELENINLKAQLVKYVSICHNCTQCNNKFDPIEPEELEVKSPESIPNPPELGLMEDGELVTININGEVPDEDQQEFSTELTEPIEVTVDPDLDYLRRQGDHSDLGSDEGIMNLSSPIDEHIEEKNGNADGQLIPQQNYGGLNYQIQNGMFRCTVSGCLKVYRDKTKLRIHYDENHRGIRWPCPFCLQLFTRKAAVKRHSENRHSKNKLDLDKLEAIEINTKEGKRKLEKLKRMVRDTRAKGRR